VLGRSRVDGGTVDVQVELLLFLEIADRGCFGVAAWSGRGRSWGLLMSLVGGKLRGGEDVGGVREVGEKIDERGGVDGVDVVLGREDDEDDDSA